VEIADRRSIGGWSRRGGAGTTMVAASKTLEGVHLARSRVLAVGLASAAVSLAACGGGAQDRSTASSGDYRSQALAAGRAYARCARAHGAPNFPDPAIQDGQLAFPNVSKADIEASGEACQGIARRIPYPPPGRVVRPSEAMYRLSVRYARCARENGLPDYPDPHRDGSDEFRGTEIGRVIYLANLGFGGRVPQAYIDVRNACEAIEREMNDQQQRERGGR
jgi:hypothetical protein